jgi:toxin FitB
VLVPTSVQFELYKWVCREASESKALEAISLTEQGRVTPLTTSIALAAADWVLAHKISFADAIIYATARHHRARLVTCDDHFQGLADVEFFAKTG